MKRRGDLAYAHARIRAEKSRLLTRFDAAPLFAANTPEQMQRAVAALELREPMARLLRIYRTAIRGYGAPLFRALLGLHEIENVKLLWRLGGEVGRLWVDLGELATVRVIPSVSEGSRGKTKRVPSRLGIPRVARDDTVERLRGTPYGGIVATVARVHANDLAAAELAFDRWATQRLREEAELLPRNETLARQLVELLAQERDAQLGLRGAKWYGLTSVETASVDIVALRHERLRLCQRAFVGSPFTIAAPLAVLLLAEEEVRAVRALVERMGDERLDPAMNRALAASQLGA